MGIIGSNLQTYSNQGKFNTDRSTWGWADIAQATVTRTFHDPSEGNYQARVLFDQGVAESASYKIIPARFDIQAGKKYKATARVYRLTSVADFSEDDFISIRASVPGDITIDSFQDQAIEGLNLPTPYKEVNIIFEAQITQSNFTGLGLFVDIGPDVLTALDIELRVDEFYIHEYDSDEPECTLAIDEDNTVVTAEAAGDDGSIQVAVTGANGDVEYSIDGENWQDSNLFAGLSDGLYTVHAREKATITCTASESFYVNEAAPTLTIEIDVTHETVLGASDGTITITASDGTAPYQYSKDGGDTYQAGNQFTDLLPGTYTVAVKDDNGEIVAQNVTVQAGTYNFTTLRYAKNPILFDQSQGANSAEDNYRITCEVQVDNDGIFEEALTTERPPDNEGKAKFNVRLAFDGYYSPTPPAAQGDLITLITDRSVRARNRFGELWDTMLDPQVYLTTQPYLVLLGGIEKRPFADIDFFNDYLPDNKKFLSWMPNPRTADKGQEDFITFLVYNQSITSLKYLIKAYYDDDTTTEQEMDVKAGVSFGQLYELRIGPANSTVLDIDPAKNLVKYDLWLTDQDDVVISEVLTIKLSEFKKTGTRYYLFLNSPGSYEVLRTTGITSGESDIRKEIINVFLPADYDPEQGEEASHNPTNQRSRQISTGYQPSKEWLEWFQDFRLSGEVFDITDGKRRRVNIEASRLPLDTDQEYMYYMKFTAREAYKNEVFTPKSV